MKKQSLLLLLSLLAGSAMAQSPSQAPSDGELRQLLEEIAMQSNVGTPREINPDLVDQGYTVKGTTLVNLIGVRNQHAEDMRSNPQLVRQQLAQAVCANEGFRKLLNLGADLRYEFVEEQGSEPIATERFEASDCNL